MGFDTALFNLINGLATQAPLLDSVMRLLVNDYLIPTCLCLITAGLWFSGGSREDRANNQRLAVRIIVALLVANMLVKLCNLVYFRPRPFSVQAVNLLFYRPSDSSLPGNPAAVAFTFAAVAWQGHRWLGVVLGVLAGLFGFARVYCGVHYPLDVVTGGMVAALSAYVVGKGQRLVEPLTDSIIRVARRLYLA